MSFRFKFLWQRLIVLRLFDYEKLRNLKYGSPLGVMQEHIDVYRIGNIKIIKGVRPSENFDDCPIDFPSTK
jgi:hypothetical protein